MNKVVLAFILLLLFVPSTLTILELLSIPIIPIGTRSIIIQLYIIFSTIYTAFIPIIAWKVLERLGYVSTSSKPTPQNEERDWEGMDEINVLECKCRSKNRPASEVHALNRTLEKTYS